MAFLKNPTSRVVGNVDPNRIDLVCQVKVEFSDLDRGILQTAATSHAFTVEVYVRESDMIAEPGAPPLNALLGSVRVSLSMGNPDAVVSLTKTFNRGDALDEDPYPAPNNVDEIQVYFGLINSFTGAHMGYKMAPVISGVF